MQTEPYDSITACVRQTYREEGVRGFFRGIIVSITVSNTSIHLYTLLGVLPPLVTVSIIKSISFSVYEETKTFLKAQSPFYARDDNLRSVMTRSTLGGAASGAFVATFSCPVSITCIYPS